MAIDWTSGNSLATAWQNGRNKLDMWQQYGNRVVIDCIWYFPAITSVLPSFLRAGGQMAIDWQEKDLALH